VAEIDLLAELAAEALLAPGRDQRDPEEILEKAAVRLVIAYDKGMMVQARRQALQELGRFHVFLLCPVASTDTTDAGVLTEGAVSPCCRQFRSLKGWLT
jgi:hypothetical protein